MSESKPTQADYDAVRAHLDERGLAVDAKRLDELAAQHADIFDAQGELRPARR